MTTCPACRAEDDHPRLGWLGRLLHFRCRWCGLPFSLSGCADDEEEE